LNYLGVTYLSLGNYNAAVASHDRGLVLSRKLGNKQAIASTLGNMGNLLKDVGRCQEARAALDEAMAMHSENQDQTMVAYSLLNIGCLELNNSNPREALDWFARSHLMLVELKDEWADLYVDEGTARCRYLLGDLTTARAIYQRIVPRLREFGDQSYVAVAMLGLGDIALAEGKFDEAAEAFSESLRIRSQLRERRSICQALENIARLESLRPQGDLVKSVQLLAAADATRKQMGVRVAPCDQGAWQQTYDRLHQQLGDERFQSIWKTAEAIDTLAAVQLALQ
jgi:tetratricopeptide (TPR) repeat protein